MKKKPGRYNSAVIAHIMLDNAAAAISFYQKAFDAKELFRIAKPNENIVHAELLIKDSIIMVGDAEQPFAGAERLKGTTVGLHIYVSDVDTLFNMAVSAGALVLQPVTDMFYGDRVGMVKDPFGHIWVLLTHITDMDIDQIKVRGELLFRS